MADIEFTVFAVYEENLQPYCTTVSAGSPEEAVLLAQKQCAADNDPAKSGDYPEPCLVADNTGRGWVEALGDFDDSTLTAFQVIRGTVQVVL